MKKLFCILTLLMIITLALSPALADSEADEYLVGKVWEMNIANFDNTEYIFFGRNGYGFWVHRYETSYGKSYYFRWETFDGYDKSYITIEFKDQEAPVNGWDLYNNPHKENTYWLLWNPDFMYMIDMTHSGTDLRSTDYRRDLHIFNATTPDPYMLERFTNEADNAFSGPFGGGGGGSR